MHPLTKSISTSASRLINLEAVRRYQRKYPDRLKAARKKYDGKRTPAQLAARRISQLKYGWTLKGRYTQLRFSANRRKLSLEISFEQWRILIEHPCVYCGASLEQTTGFSLDRLDNRVGYNEGNVAPCCMDCNFVKGQLEGAGFVYPRTAELMRELRGTI